MKNTIIILRQFFILCINIKDTYHLLVNSSLIDLFSNSYQLFLNTENYLQISKHAKSNNKKN